jgi:hypothetical protein
MSASSRRRISSIARVAGGDDDVRQLAVCVHDGDRSANGARFEGEETPVPQLRRERPERRRIVVEKQHGFSDEQARGAAASLRGFVHSDARRIAEAQIDAKDRTAAHARAHADVCA